MKWTVLQHLFAQASRYLVFFVLSAVVAPEELGLITLASSSLAVLAAFTETGFGAAIIQRRELEGGHLSSTFAINVAVGLVLTLVGVALGLAAARVYDSPRLLPLMTALAAGFLIRSLGVTHATIAQREMRFRSLAMRDLLAACVSGVIGVGMALAGYGVWSLVASALVGATVSVIFMWSVDDWRPRASEVSRRHTVDLWQYSSRILGFNLGKALVQNSDRLIIGFVLGAHAVGLYAFASKLVVAPVSGFVGAVGAYLFPAVSRVQHDRQAVRTDYLRTMRMIMRVVLAYLVLVTFLAPAAITPIFGPEWNAAVPVLRWLSIAAFLASIYSPFGQLLKALNRPGWLLAWSAVFSLLMLLGVAIGAQWGLVGAAIGFSAAHVMVVPAAAAMTRRISSFTLKEMLIGSRDSVIGAAGIALLLWAIGDSV
ncbi:MAG: lipopolysaccharide biosynthesis protein, partial [Longimicrobiales bacterium]